MFLFDFVDSPRHACIYTHFLTYTYTYMHGLKDIAAHTLSYRYIHTIHEVTTQKQTGTYTFIQSTYTDGVSVCDTCVHMISTCHVCISSSCICMYMCLLLKVFVTVSLSVIIVY